MSRFQFALLLLFATVGCRQPSPPAAFKNDAIQADEHPPGERASGDQAPPNGQVGQTGESRSDSDDPFADVRQEMRDQQIRARGVRDVRVLEAIGRVPRHRFVPSTFRDMAYDDRPLPIGHGQTISQPYIVALMTELVQPQATDRVLEIGTGCGYQSAILAELVKTVYTIEIVQPLADEARERLKNLGYSNIHVRSGDGYQGWPEHAPFQAIVVTAAPDHIPQPLVEQLAPGGRMVIPVGRFTQELLLLEKLEDGQVRESRIAPVAFVPMTGEAERR
jgi:protein-L-isoaspartate(D-aspartate) O-methyltransferase